VTWWTRAGLIAAALAATGCAGGSSSHVAMTATQAIHQARADGFVDVGRRRAGSWRCAPHAFGVGPAQTTGRYSDYARPVYSVEFGDRRAPAHADNTARVGMAVDVFRSAAFAARCAKSALESERLLMSHGKLLPYKVISDTTVEHGMHPVDTPGNTPGDTGQFETWLADGRAFAWGIAYNAHDSRIVQADLARLAHEVGG
jgi:hypothetical protein